MRNATIRHDASARLPGPSGHLTGLRLGPVRLGETRAAIRRALAHLTTRHHRDLDYFCLAGDGIRVEYPSPKLLRTPAAGQRRRVQGISVLVLTANHHYTLDGIRPGTRLANAGVRLRHARHYHVGRNTWYLIPSHTNTGILKVQHRRIHEIGIANPHLTATPRSARRFLSSLN